MLDLKKMAEKYLSVLDTLSAADILTMLDQARIDSEDSWILDEEEAFPVCSPSAVFSTNARLGKLPLYSSEYTLHSTTGG